MSGVSHVSLQRITVGYCQGTGAVVSESMNVGVDGCAFINNGQAGLEVSGGSSVTVSGCGFSFNGCGGASMAGGDVATLVSGACGEWTAPKESHKMCVMVCV
jgi:hypothetical protein